MGEDESELEEGGEDVFIAFFVEVIGLGSPCEEVVRASMVDLWLRTSSNELVCPLKSGPP